MGELLTRKEAAKFLKVSVSTLKKWDGKGITQPLRTNKAKQVRYSREQVQEIFKIQNQ